MSRWAFSAGSLALAAIDGVCNGGATNTGAVDDLERAADLCAAERMWLHVDAAYGGAAILVEEGRAAFRGIGT